MTGMEIAWRTLNMERVSDPCILTSWVMKPEFYEEITGRDYFSDPVGVALDTFRRVGANLCPQLALPYRRGKPSTGDWEASDAATRERWQSAEQVRDAIEALPDPATLWRDFSVEQAREGYARSIMELRERTEDDILWIAGFGQSDFMGGYSRWRYENYLECLSIYPDHMRRYYDYTGEQGYLYNLGVVEAIQKYDLAPFVYGGQDICFNEGPICSVETLRDLYFPALRRAVEPLLRSGIRIIWHCDGNILPILDDLLDLGVSGFQGFQEESGVHLSTMAGVRTKWEMKPILWGSVSVTTTLPFGSEDDVRRDVERCFDIAGPGGGFGLASTSSILPETPTGNILAMYERGIEYGRYVLGG
ncbi:hypothetical protein FJZ36_15445 [Candidatus Poribacteria bacterium]|nr:hypothetical protein [Candidatus Poribacteria bacterium]